MSPEDIHEAWRAATTAWPGLDVTEAAFAEYLQARLAASEGAAGVHAADLLLACACARGDERALATFDREILADADAALKRVAGSVPPDEIKQLVRHRLFVGPPGGAPKILDYAGRGRLRTWVRVAATRIALNVIESTGKERPLDNDAIAHIIGAGDDPELGYLKRRYAAEFRAAFGDAFTALETRDRNLLRYAFGEALTVDAIGALYSVHRATAARWITKAHAALVEQIRKAMLARLHVDKDEYASILRLIESQIEISFERYLGSPRPADEVDDKVGT
jgi:RNA polymerase sigma-70 factor (ECF subfamily)